VERSSLTTMGAAWAQAFTSLQASLQASLRNEVDAFNDADLGFNFSNTVNVRTDPNILNRFQFRPHLEGFNIDTGGIELMVVFVVMIIMGGVVALSRSKSKNWMLWVLVLALALDAAWFSPHPTSPRRDPASIVELPSMLAEHPAKVEHRSVEDFIKVLLPQHHDKVNDFKRSQTCKQVFDAAQTIGSITTRLTGARAILGKVLLDEKHSKLLKAVKQSEKASEKYREVQLAQVRFVRKVKEDIVPSMSRLVDTMRKKDRSESGVLGFRHLQAEGKYSKFYDRAKENLAEVMNSDHASLDVKGVVSLYKQTQKNINAALGSLDSTYPHEMQEVRRLQEDIHEAATASAKADEEVVAAASQLGFALANQKAYTETRTLQGGMEARIKSLIKEKKDDLAQSEADLKRYTYNMYNQFFSMWENDVNLAEKKVKERKKELKELELRFIQHKANEEEAKQVGGMQAKVEGDLQKAQLVWEQKKTSAKQAEKALTDKTDELANRLSILEEKAKQSGLQNYRELCFLKSVQATIHKDAKVAAGLALLDTDPFQSLKIEMKRVLEDMKDEEYVLPQAAVLTSFIEMINAASVADGKSEWQSVVAMYTSIDLGAFNELVNGFNMKRMLSDQKVQEAQQDLFPKELAQ